MLHDFIQEGHFARHLRRTRAVYAERRRVLVAALERELGESCRVVGDHAGIHLVLLLPPGTRDRDVAVRAARRGLSVVPLSSCYAGRGGRARVPARAGLLLGYGATRASEIPEAVRHLRGALEERG